MIVTVLAEKGGTGKTMVATNLAGMRAGAGRRVLLVDADRQGSSERWTNLRAASGLPHVECVPLYGGALSRYLRNRISGYDDVVIDVGAGDSDEMSTALSASDCAVVPVRPTAADVWTMTLMDSRIGEAGMDNTGLRAWALINQASTNPRHPAAAQTRRDARRRLRLHERRGAGGVRQGGVPAGVRGGAERCRVQLPLGEGRAGVHRALPGGLRRRPCGSGIRAGRMNHGILCTDGDYRWL